MARKVMVFFWAGTLAFVALFVGVGFSSSGEGAIAGVFLAVGALFFGIAAVASTVAWLILGAREITRPPTDQAQRPTDREQTPS
jgi:hypothetical protein